MTKFNIFSKTKADILEDKSLSHADKIHALIDWFEEKGSEPSMIVFQHLESKAVEVFSRLSKNGRKEFLIELEKHLKDSL